MKHSNFKINVQTLFTYSGSKSGKNPTEVTLDTDPTTTVITLTRTGLPVPRK